VVKKSVSSRSEGSFLGNLMAITLPRWNWKLEKACARRGGSSDQKALIENNERYPKITVLEQNGAGPGPRSGYGFDQEETKKEWRKGRDGRRENAKADKVERRTNPSGRERPAYVETPPHEKVKCERKTRKEEEIESLED